MSKNFATNQKENYRKNYGEMQPLSKTDKNRKKSYRGNYWALVVVLMLSFVCMSGCNSEQKEEEPVASAEPVVTEDADGLEEFDDIAESEVAEEPEVSEEFEVIEEPEEPSVDLTGYENVDNEELAIWMATTETLSFGVYIWDAETETAIEVVDGEYYDVTAMDELVIRTNENISPAIVGRGMPDVMEREYFIYKLNDITESTYMYINMVAMDENMNIIETDYEIEFYVESYNEPLYLD